MKWLDDIKFKMDVNLVMNWLKANDYTTPCKETITKSAAKLIKVECKNKQVFFTIHRRVQNRVITDGPDGRYHWAYDKYEVLHPSNPTATDIKPSWSGYYPYSWGK